MAPDPVTAGGAGYIGAAGAGAAPGMLRMSTFAVGWDGSPHRARSLMAWTVIKEEEIGLMFAPNLDAAEHEFPASYWIPMTTAGFNTGMWSDQSGNNPRKIAYSKSPGGGAWLDMSVEPWADYHPAPYCTCTLSTGTYFLFTPDLDLMSSNPKTTP